MGTLPVMPRDWRHSFGVDTHMAHSQLAPTLQREVLDAGTRMMTSVADTGKWFSALGTATTLTESDPMDDVDIDWSTLAGCGLGPANRLIPTTTGIWNVVGSANVILDSGGPAATALTRLSGLLIIGDGQTAAGGSSQGSFRPGSFGAMLSIPFICALGPGFTTGVSMGLEPFDEPVTTAVVTVRIAGSFIATLSGGS